MISLLAFKNYSFLTHVGPDRWLGGLCCHVGPTIHWLGRSLRREILPTPVFLLAKEFLEEPGKLSVWVAKEIRHLIHHTQCKQWFPIFVWSYFFNKFSLYSCGHAFFWWLKKFLYVLFLKLRGVYDLNKKL